MPSLIWNTVYLFLLSELALTAILVVPVPRKIRNSIARKICKFKLGERIAKPVLFAGFVLAFAMTDSYLKHEHVLNRIEEEHAAGNIHTLGHEHYFHGHDKEKKYKAERNMYLAGFSLTLLFVIGRITQLMQENVELEEEAGHSKQKPESKEDKKND
jgi:hypothetical protein